MSKFNPLLPFLLLFFVFSAFSQSRAFAENFTGKKIVEVVVSGPDLKSAQRIKLALRTREGGKYDPTVADSDVKSLYVRNLVDDVSLFLEEVNGGVRVIFRVVQKKIIKSIRFLPKSTYYGDTYFTEKILSKAGEHYSFAVASQDEELIKAKYRKKGYLAVKVTHSIVENPNGRELVFTIEQGTRYAVGDIIFTGNTVFSSRKLRRRIHTKRRDLFHGGSFDEHDIAMDLELIRMIYMNEGYLDAEVTLLPFDLPVAPDGWKRTKKLEFTLRINIEEGTQYKINAIEFTGETVFSKEELSSIIIVKSGDIAQFKYIVKSVQKLRDEVGETGRAFTRVKPEIVPAEDPRMVDVIFHINQSGVVSVQEVIVQGNVETRENVVRREIRIYPGEALTVKGMRETQRNLQRTGYYTDVSIGFEPRSKSLTDVIVTVKEGRTGSFMMGGGVSSDSNVFVRLSLTERNFDISKFPWIKGIRGAGQNLTLSCNLGTTMTAFSINFLEPHLRDSEYRFGFGISRVENSRSTYDDTRIGGHLLVGKNLTENLSISLIYTFQHVIIDNLEDDAPAAVVIDEGSHDLGSLTFRCIYKNVDNPYIPSTGWDVKADFAVFNGALLSDYDFYRVTLRASRYFNLYTTEAGSKHTLLVRSTLGHMEEFGNTDIIPTFVRFYSGGISSVRGFQAREIGPRQGEDPIGGYFRASASLEYFVPLYADVFYFATFIDAGGCWEDIGDFDSDGIRYGAGFGVYIKTPISPMPIRIYYTDALNPEEGEDTDSIQFSFGFMF